jgi:signal transduction histidine kinase
MTLKLRFTLLLSLLLGGFVTAVVVLRTIENEEKAEMVRGDRQARVQLLTHWIDVTGRVLPQFAAEIARPDAVESILTAQRSDAAREKLATELASAGVAWLWIVRGDGSVRLTASATARTARADPPLDAHELATLFAETPSPRFFAENGPELIELCARRISASAGAVERDWVLIARPWDDAHLRALSALTESRITLLPPSQHASSPGSDTHLELVRPLADWRGRTLRVLHVHYDIPEIERTVARHRSQSWVFVGFGLLLITALALALYQWVLLPLRKIATSLGSQNATLVSDLSREESELGQVAGLVLTSFDQRAALEREIRDRARTQEALERSEAALRRNLEDRARLGRDLHDGVIQSLYAAGMGLAGVRMQLKPEQTEAATRLEQTRAALNETIHDVRNFIIGLEPEALKLQTFSQAIAALLEVMRGMRPFQSTVEVSEELAGQLTLAQRVHALQIAREAVSNALRHGEARHIHIALRRSGEFAEFEIADNGRGFDSTYVPVGKGLANFVARARELGGELHVDSKPSEGTRVRLTFSLLIL